MEVEEVGREEVDESVVMNRAWQCHVVPHLYMRP
jgi:hypothetical protein